MVYNEKLDNYLIDKKTNSNSHLDYDRLRTLGIELTQRLSGESWTDYNEHDPGMTILEHLCYALTDLAYRTGFEPEDILTSVSGHIDRVKNSFFTRAEILSSNPASINDFRKVIIDNVPEVNNAWLEPVLSQNPMQYCKGLYRVLIRLEDQKANELRTLNKKQQDSFKNDILLKVKRCVNEYRNIGEDFEDFIILKPSEIKITATVIIERVESPEEMLAEIYAALYRTLNPEIHFYSEKELLAQGYSLEEINNGPLMHNGYIADEELTPRPAFVDPTDLAKVISAISGVRYVQGLSIEVENKKYEQELCPIKTENFLFFDLDKEDSSIHLINDNFKIPVRTSVFHSRLNIKLDHFTGAGKGSARKEFKKENESDSQFNIKGSYRHLGKYYSFQNLFPEIYNLKTDISKGEIHGAKNIIEIAKVKQLKAFLMFFEQVIVNYLAQLANIENIFSPDINKDSHTYFTRAVNAPGAEHIIGDFHSHDNDPYSKFLSEMSETDTTFINRKNRVLEHILARFNFIFHQYPLQLFGQMYFRGNTEGRLTPELLWKKKLVENLPSLLRNRNQAYNYTQRGIKKKPGGFHEKILHLLYIGIEQTPRSPEHNEYESKRLTASLSNLMMSFTDVTSQPDKMRAQKTGLLVFTKTGITLFRDGLNRKNYKIVSQGDDKNIKQVIYKAPNDPDWRTVGRFNDLSSAMKSLNDFISHLRKINIESEGFHVIEHILLRPNLQTHHFGFKLLDANNHLLCQHNEWTTFENRDRNITRLLDYADQSRTIPREDFESALEKICKIAIEHSESPRNIISPSLIRHSFKNKEEEIKKIYRRLICNLEKIRNNPFNYPVIKPIVKRINGEEIAEDFFNFRMTIILPSWPARFQDNSFREFIKKLFLEHCPAHMRLGFKWLDIKKMREFESFYFNWLDSMSDRTAIESMKVADRLISMIDEIKIE